MQPLTLLISLKVKREEAVTIQEEMSTKSSVINFYLINYKEFTSEPAWTTLHPRRFWKYYQHISYLNSLYCLVLVLTWVSTDKILVFWDLSQRFRS